MRKTIIKDNGTGTIKRDQPSALQFEKLLLIFRIPPLVFSGFHGIEKRYSWTAVHGRCLTSISIFQVNPQTFPKLFAYQWDIAHSMFIFVCSLFIFATFNKGKLGYRTRLCRISYISDQFFYIHWQILTCSLLGHIVQRIVIPEVSYTTPNSIFTFTVSCRRIWGW